MAELDKEEKDLLESNERDEWRSVADQGAEIERYRGYARAYIEKLRRMISDRVWKSRREDSDR